jgi:restriction system protein
MPVPDFQTIMLPFLRLLKDSKEYAIRDTVELLADEFNLSESERREMLPSGQQTILYNRVVWARTYLKKAGLIESTKRGVVKITDRGLQVLKSNPERIDINFLDQFPEFVEFKKMKREKPSEFTSVEVETPEEVLENSFQILRQSLANEILDQIRSNPPSLFEKIVVELLVKMGYGGTLRDAGQAIGKSGDEGIDGIIKEDRLGLDIIYVQAKRWANTVVRPEIQKFAGALQGQRAKKGVFITTSDFSRDAHEYAAKIDSKIVLIDGEQLAQFMIDHNIGVTPVASYEIKRIDSDYFSEE